jgi:hypothetical protein
MPPRPTAEISRRQSPTGKRTHHCLCVAPLSSLCGNSALAFAGPSLMGPTWAREHNKIEDVCSALLTSKRMREACHVETIPWRERYPQAAPWLLGAQGRPVSAVQVAKALNASAAVKRQALALYGLCANVHQTGRLKVLSGYGIPTDRAAPFFRLCQAAGCPRRPGDVVALLP